jgi:parallel beta-helix repeat protein
VDRSLSIIGNGTNSTTITPSQNEHIIVITAERVNVSGFTVTDAGSNMQGIRILADNATISNCTVSYSRTGIVLYESDDTVIVNNQCSENYRTGIHISNSYGVSVINNTACYNNVGINIESSESIVSGNNCSSNSIVGLSFGNSPNSLIEQNTFNNNGIDGLFLSQTTGGTISGNICTSNGRYGIHARGNQDCDLIANSIASNTEYGISLNGGYRNLINNNTIISNEIGIWIDGGSENNNITFNTIVDNEKFAMNATFNEGVSVDARQNWWGNNSGPHHPLSNPHGTGGNDTDNIAFFPWVTVQDGSLNGNEEEDTESGDSEFPYEEIISIILLLILLSMFSILIISLWRKD